jgi:hypothetical protein
MRCQYTIWFHKKRASDQIENEIYNNKYLLHCVTVGQILSLCFS